MTWGPYWMFYQCATCGKKFRQALDDTTIEQLGMCPSCAIKGELKAESNHYPADANDYEIV